MLIYQAVMAEFKEKFRAPQSFIDQFDNVSFEHSKTNVSPQRSRMETMAGATNPAGF